MDFYKAMGFKPMGKPRRILIQNPSVPSFYELVDGWLERYLPVMLKIIIGYLAAHIVVAIFRYI